MPHNSHTCGSLIVIVLVLFLDSTSMQFLAVSMFEIKAKHVRPSSSIFEIMPRICLLSLRRESPPPTWFLVQSSASMPCAWFLLYAMNLVTCLISCTYAMNLITCLISCTYTMNLLTCSIFCIYAMNMVTRSIFYVYDMNAVTCSIL